MGLGYFLTEKVEYDSSGLLLTNGTWEYKPPMVKDIPSVFNVTLLKNMVRHACTYVFCTTYFVLRILSSIELALAKLSAFVTHCVGRFYEFVIQC